MYYEFIEAFHHLFDAKMKELFRSFNVLSRNMKNWKCNSAMKHFTRGDETSSRIVSDEEIEKKKLEAHYGFMAKIQEVLPAESSSIDTPLEQVQNHDESNVFANERRHSEQPESINDTYVLEKDDTMSFHGFIKYIHSHVSTQYAAMNNGRSTFANPKYLKKAQSDKPRLYEIPYDTSDPANRFCPDGEETVTLEKRE
ncbi:hypothetical protein Tco_0559914 [Tanacetum coccineum]